MPTATATTNAAAIRKSGTSKISDLRHLLLAAPGNGGADDDGGSAAATTTTAMAAAEAARKEQEVVVVSIDHTSYNETIENGKRAVSRSLCRRYGTIP